MLTFLQQPWHWSVAGIMVGLTVPALLLLGNKHFGISANLRHICAACLPANIPFFSYAWRKEIWNFFFIAGVAAGAFLATYFLSNPAGLEIAPATVADLKALGVQDFSQLLPQDLFGTSALFSVRGLVFMVMGGFLVGFGARYAGGCTSGHAISGLANLQWPSLVATIFFMVGGFLMTHWGLPLLFQII